jgi:hypothetical protein
MCLNFDFVYFAPRNSDGAVANIKAVRLSYKQRQENNEESLLYCQWGGCRQGLKVDAHL